MRLLFIILSLSFYSCQESKGDTKVSDSIELEDESPRTLPIIDIDSMVNTHKDSLLFMNYWGGMSADEFELVTDYNLDKKLIKKGSSESSPSAMVTGGFKSTLQVDYTFLDTIMTLNFFYLAPIRFEKDERLNYTPHKEIRESPNGGIILFSGVRDFTSNKHLDSLFKNKFSKAADFHVETRGGCCLNNYAFYDSLYIGFTHYSGKLLAPGNFSAIIIRSKSDGEYLLKNSAIHPSNYNPPKFDYGIY